jgi:uncharacterized protein DUF5715
VERRLSVVAAELLARWQDDLRALGVWAIAAAVALSAASGYALLSRTSGAKAAPKAHSQRKAVRYHKVRAHRIRHVRGHKAVRVRRVHRRRFLVRPASPAGLQRDAAAGVAHVLYAFSSHGAVATAQRVARWRNLISAEARSSGFSANTLEGIVFLESGGYSEAIAGSDPVAASGLTQIVAQTGMGFLHMRVNLRLSRKLTFRIDRLEARGKFRKADRLAAIRRQVDQRFDPAAALAATVRYLTVARGYLGRDDLAVASYHMGIGNLQGVIARWAGQPLSASTARIVRADRLSYAKLFFTSSPDRHASAWARLNALNDDTRNYYWKVLAAERIMWLYRHSPSTLETDEWLQAQKNSAEEVLHPRTHTFRFARPKDIVSAERRHTLLPLPASSAKTHIAVSPFLGQMAHRLHRSRKIYRALRPGSLSILLYIGERVHQLSGARRPLLVTSAVRDLRYQNALKRVNENAARTYSLHTTGYAFDLARSYQNRRQAAALQFVLDRLQALDLIAYIKESDAIHVAVASHAARRLSLLRADA